MGLSGKNIAVITAHPDDETLWCGGTILINPDCNWFIACLCRKNDKNRSPKFYEVLKVLNARGVMGNLDDSPEQQPLSLKIVKEVIVGLLPSKNYDLIITHDPSGEYTRHRRHEEISRAVIELWYKNKISTKELWTFAYEDGNKKYLPRKKDSANIQVKLTKEIFDHKYKLITEIYGFPPDGFEALTTPKDEAFWKFETPVDAFIWLRKDENLK
ncbi:PIG-L family deacetylase [Gramella sp. KN1008]|nr:PIG-L family deacetylase [Gramella sp. KN1008]